jgi:hypothetical protein
LSVTGAQQRKKNRFGRIVTRRRTLRKIRLARAARKVQREAACYIEARVGLACQPHLKESWSVVGGEWRVASGEGPAGAGFGDLEQLFPDGVAQAQRARLRSGVNFEPAACTPRAGPGRARAQQVMVQPGDRHVDFGENGKARIDPVLVRKRAFLETFGLVTVEAKEPPLSCKSDHVSPYWYIRGVTPHRRIRRL